MSKKISVIVPVYNTEKYLERCVSSICNSTYSNLEIILVDDGSTDSSVALCDKLKGQDIRIKVIHKTNGGLSDARNAGLDIAVGDYISFVDSDDYIEPEMYEHMLSVMLNEHVSICVCMWEYIFADGHPAIDLTKVNNRIFGRHSATEFASFLFQGAYENGVVVAAWNKLYERGIFETLRFEGRFLEDDYMCNNLLRLPIELFVVDGLYYNYFQNQNSLTNQGFNERYLAFLDILLDRYEKIESVKTKTLMLYANMCMEFYFKSVEAGLVFPVQHLRKFREFLRHILFHGDFTLKLKIRSTLFLMIPSLYKRLILRV